MVPHGLRNQVLTWGRRGAWAVAEQALYSVVVFGTNVALARWLTPHDFGAFTLAFAGFLFMTGVYNALLLEPAMVLGPSMFAGNLAGYLARLPELHWRVTLAIAIPIALPLGIVTILAPGAALPRSLLSAAVFLPLLLRIWLARRVAYILGWPQLAVATNLLYGVLVLGGLVAARLTGRVSAPLALAILGIASWVASGAANAKLIPSGAPAGDDVSRSALLRAHWRYGHWIVWATVLGAISLQGPPYIIGWVLGLDATGTVRAMDNVASPVAQGLTALGFLALPALARDFGARDLAAVERKARLVTAVLTPLAVGYCLAVAALHEPLEGLLFDHKYARHSSLMVVLSIYPVFMALTLGPSLFLRAVQHARHYLAATAMVAPVGVVAPLVLSWQFGLAGAAWSMVVIFFASWLAMLLLVRLWRRTHEASPDF